MRRRGEHARSLAAMEEQRRPRGVLSDEEMAAVLSRTSLTTIKLGGEKVFKKKKKRKKKKRKSIENPPPDGMSGAPMRRHRVQKTDSLASIAVKYDVDVRGLAQSQGRMSRAWTFIAQSP